MFVVFTVAVINRAFSLRVTHRLTHRRSLLSVNVAWAEPAGASLSVRTGETEPGPETRPGAGEAFKIRTEEKKSSVLLSGRTGAAVNQTGSKGRKRSSNSTGASKQLDPAGSERFCDAGSARRKNRDNRITSRLGSVLAAGSDQI